MTTAKLLGLAAATVFFQPPCQAFIPPTPFTNRHIRPTPSIPNTATTQLHDVKIMNDGGGSPDAPRSPQEDAALQWDLFTKHHARDGEWWGTWTTYDYMGDVKDSTVAAVSLQPDAELTSVVHTHKFLTASTSSDCDTCFDSSQVKTLPTIATYTPETLGKRHRLGAVGMVVGPSLLPSGVMSTELTLRHGDGRVRVTFQHAPVWERGIEPGSCPPQGLKLFRAIVSKEKLRTSSSEESTEGKFQGPPSAEEEKSNPPSPGNPKFFRPIPPFKWHAQWSGTSWTWGPTSGDRGWAIQEVEEADAWHGRPAGDTAQTWSLRVPGGVLIQCPRVVIGGTAGLCRVAWLPEDEGEEGTVADGNRAKLLRLEASVMALEPVISDEDENMMVGFYPPSLGSLRCDVLEKIGELEGQTLQDREAAAEGFVWSSIDEQSGETSSANGSMKEVETKAPVDDEELSKKIAADPRNALDF